MNAETALAGNMMSVSIFGSRRTRPHAYSENENFL